MKIERITVGPLQTNCYLLADGGKVIVVDPGDEADNIIAKIQKINSVPEAIVNTHNHFDHIGADIFLKKRYNVPVMAGIKEKTGTDFCPDVLLKGGEVIKIGDSIIKVIETPGHTRGGICLLGDGFAISGDTLFDGNIGRTDLEGGSDKEMAVSLEKLDKAIPDGTVIYPGHGPIFKYHKGMAKRWIDFLK